MMDKAYMLLAQVIREGELENIPNKTGVREASIADLITAALGVAGGVAFIAVVYGGIKYIWSRGNPQETAKAQNTILYALIGLVFCIFAATVVRFVVDRAA